MKLETIKKDKKKHIIIGSMVVLSMVGCLTLTTTKAKYRSVQSLKLASGIVKYSASDLHLVAVKVSEDGANYTEQIGIPTSGYTLNTEKSKCRIPTSTLVGEDAPADESIPIEYKDGRVYIGVNTKNTRCYLYFDKLKIQTSSTIIATIEKSGSSYKGDVTPSFGTVATGAETEVNNGIFKVNDGMYGGSSYYWRGAATTNHVIFDSKCWRIVRINGDKSIRLIYNGTPSGITCSGNGNALAVYTPSDSRYSKDGAFDKSYYVGWTYGLGQRTLSGTPSNVKTQTENWYSNNILEAAKKKVDSNGKFCNDRNVQSNQTWVADGAAFNYASGNRVYARNAPTLSCETGDIYILSVGAITADEVMFAGGKSKDNTKYYLYTGNSYWTMTPYYWNGASSLSYVFIVKSSGYLETEVVFSTAPGIRPVINLRSDVTFNAGSDGTKDNPYVVIE